MSHPYMPLFVADFLADTAHLSAAETGAYFLLILNYWQRGKPLPADDRKLARIARMSDAEWQEVRNTIAEFFAEADGVWNHKRIDAELAVAACKSAKARASARASVEARRANADTSQESGRESGRPPAQGSPNERSANAELLGKVRIGEISSSPNGSEETRAGRAPSDWPADFREQFWDIFPNKVGKAAALAKLEAIRKRRDVPWLRLMDGLRLYLAKTDDRPWCNPLTWLNQGRWDDAPAANARASPRYSDQNSFESFDPDAIVANLKARQAAKSETVQ